MMTKEKAPTEARIVTMTEETIQHLCYAHAVVMLRLPPRERLLAAKLSCDCGSCGQMRDRIIYGDPDDER